MAIRRVIFVVSDGEHTVNTNRQAVIDAAGAFKAAGGIVVAMGTRAAGNGFDLLERIASPGFFVNAHPPPIAKTPRQAFDELSYLKSILCVGRCVPAGDVYVNKPTFTYDFPSTSLWQVPSGLVHLLGPGLLDLLPGHGLYLDMAGGTAALLRTIDSYELKSGRDYEITVFAAGNQRANIAGQSLKVYLRAIDAADTDPNLFERILAPAWNQEFSEFSYAFNAIADQPVKLYVEQLYTGANPTMGNLVDRIVFTDVTTNTVLLDDNFDNENLTYVPPRCGPSASLEEISNPESPTAEVYFESGLVPTDEAYQYAVSYVTREGETAATRLLVSGTNTTVTLDNSVILVQMPVPDDPRVISKRLWRSLGVVSGSYDPDITNANLFLLAETDPRQVNYLDAERTADFGARYDNSITAPEENTTTVPAGDLGVGLADCCYFYNSPFTTVGNEPLVPLMTDTDQPDGFVCSMGGETATYEEDWKHAFDQQVSSRVAFAQDGAGVIDQPVDQADSVEYVQIHFLFGAQIATSYSVQALESTIDQQTPKTWKIYGSNNGTTWTELDSQTGITFGEFEVKTFPIASPGSYAYYRYSPSAVDGTQPGVVGELQYYGGVGVVTGQPTGFLDECPDCTDQPPGAQVPALNPLPNNETTDQPPVITSSQQACAFCGPDQQQTVNQVPTMTSNVLPSGTASASSEVSASNAAWHAFDGNNGTFWQPVRANGPWTLAFAFAAATTVNYYRIYPGLACPLAWTFEGSDDGTTWTVLDTQAVPSWAGFAMDFFPAAEASYKRYRLNISNSISGATNGIVQIQSFELMQVQAVAQSCATATGSGSTSSEADADAYAKALVLANQQLNCIPKWTSTVSYTARCGIGELGNEVTKVVTKESLISFNDAHALAYNEAKAAAEADPQFDCTLSNNTQQINILDFTGGEMAKASLYPSVLRVTGGPVSITKVVVNIFGFTHGSPDDVHIALRSPAGTIVELMRNSGGAPPTAGASVSNIDLVFDSDEITTLPDSAPLVSDTYNPAPANGAFAPYPPPLGTYVLGVLDTTPYPNDLADFATEDANGSWSLWVCDDLSIYTGKISKWTLTIT